MTDLTNLLAPFRKRVEAYRDHGTPGLHAPQDRARLLAALEGVLALHHHAHKAVEPWAAGYKFSGDHCAHDGDHWPCPTVAAVVAALGEGL